MPTRSRRNSRTAVRNGPSSAEPARAFNAADATDTFGIEPFGRVSDTDDQAERDDEQQKSRQAEVAGQLGVGRTESGGDIVEACQEGTRILADQRTFLLDVAVSF